MSELPALAQARFTRSCDVPTRFFEAEATQVSQACLAMARRFRRGGRLLAFGAGKALTDALHVAVEFVHPVIVGKRALPAVALGSDGAATAAFRAGQRWRHALEVQLVTLGDDEDIALGIDPGGNDPAVLASLNHAAAAGLLTIGLSGGDGGQMAALPLDFSFVVPSTDTAVIQETHETLYHILWELVHVFFEHDGLLVSDDA